MEETIEYSELRLSKARTLFSVYDHDGSGYIEKADFETIAENFIQARSLPPGGHESQELNRLFVTVWEELSKLADKDENGLIAFREMLVYLDILRDDPVLFHDQVLALSDLLFRLLDTDEDESVTAKEYLEFAHCFRFETSIDTFFKLS